MKTFRNSGDPITIPAPYDVSSGDVVIFGLIVGIAITDALSGADVALDTDGIHELSKVSAQAWTVGQAVYVHVNTDLTRTMTTSASGNTKVGVAAAVADNPSSTGLVRLNGTF